MFGLEPGTWFPPGGDIDKTENLRQRQESGHVRRDLGKRHVVAGVVANQQHEVRTALAKLA